MSQMPNTADMLQSGFDIGKFHNDNATHSWPSKWKYSKSCDRFEDFSRCKDTAEYWCAHCNGWYCIMHEDDHNFMSTKCYGISYNWVIDKDWWKRGRCDRWYGKSQGLLQAGYTKIHCMAAVYYYCKHCNSYYCCGHRDSHNKHMSKCEGAKYPSKYTVKVSTRR